MAVPDWPNTYGYNMFLFPMSQWVGGIFYEHTHRLLAATVGFLTLILAAWLWIAEKRRWLRWLGIASVVAVILQGVLGGLRVVLSKQDIGIAHAALGQLFLILVVLTALFLSSFWRGLDTLAKITFHPWLQKSIFLTTLLIFCQLLLGASMRHQHAGLAVPDFPLAYGKLWPPTDAGFVEEANRKRLDARDFEPITAGQIYLHMAHRVGALAVLAAVALTFVLARKGQSFGATQTLTTAWLLLILLQAALGAWTVLSNKAADIATAHVVVGALSLLTGAVLYPITKRMGAREPIRNSQSANLPAFNKPPLRAHA
jgi:cytochrome c oxidase assembly protein subunit 15